MSDGQGGDDIAYGGYGGDLLIDGAGIDYLFGEEGDDRFRAASDGVTDFLDGGDGADIREIIDPNDQAINM